MRRPQGPEPRPPGQAAADRRGDGPLGVRTPGWAPFVLPRLCSTEKTPHDVSGWKHVCPLLRGRKTRMRPGMGLNTLLRCSLRGAKEHLSDACHVELSAATEDSMTQLSSEDGKRKGCLRPL